MKWHRSEHAIETNVMKVIQAEPKGDVAAFDLSEERYEERASMGTRSLHMIRCPRCRMHEHLCICSAIPCLDLVTRVVLVMHRHEVTKPTSTGPLAVAALPNSEIRIHGYEERRLDLSDLDQPQRRLLLLYPREDAAVLGIGFLERDPRPVTLVVPDGNWRQAARMGKRIPGLERAETVRLPEAAGSEWGVRKAKSPTGLSTLEAIARAIGIIESPEAQAALEGVFRLMVDRVLRARGRGKDFAG